VKQNADKTSGILNVECTGGMAKTNSVLTAIEDFMQRG